MSTHIGAKKGEIAKIVFLSGCPLRAKYMAYRYLDNVKLVNTVRNELFYTGTYNGTPVTFGGSGMGMMSIAAYAHELFSEYGVDVIVRTGTAGGYLPEYEVGDVVIMNRAYADNRGLGELINAESTHVYYPDAEIVEKLEKSATELQIPYKTASIHSTDCFYAMRPLDETIQVTESQVIDCESYALFAVARHFGKSAATICQVSDNLVLNEFSSQLTREREFTDMYLIALNALVK
ncbi:phosphorylase family protein [Mycoplasmopsis columbinasalis]|uniref:Uridine phosphorylase n=1 Tax=Mycoplasmopsis columbinasalis TaxID=114880 RepID=A0A449BAA1_9BACT|nr:purine nucleoside phosphorylase DeoD-type [Mycoplasmopsis columbinasalis]VEU78130.1 purine-nucleoside phosphorylase [Mycoplasmopsis columbinasalis]